METFGHYRLLKRLATGGMAQLYLAQKSDSVGDENLVVVKRILPHLAENEDFVRMFLDEARIAARLNHPNVIQILDLGSQGDSFFIAMEYIPGHDLRKLWKRAQQLKRTIPVALAARIIHDVCAGLEYAHNRTDAAGAPLDIVHRDISPQNILVSSQGIVKIVDFGIAKAADQGTVTRSGVLKGKYSYMSPQQAAGDKIDRRSDIFAAGIVFYELLTSSRLFKRASDIQTLGAVTACRVVAPSILNPLVPSDIDAIAMKALVKNPDQRYQDAGVFRMALAQWLSTVPAQESSVEALASFVASLYQQAAPEEIDPGPTVIRGEDASDSSLVAEPMGRNQGSELAADLPLNLDVLAPQSISIDRSDDFENTSSVVGDPNPEKLWTMRLVMFFRQLIVLMAVFLVVSVSSFSVLFVAKKWRTFRSRPASAQSSIGSQSRPVMGDLKLVENREEPKALPEESVAPVARRASPPKTLSVKKSAAVPVRVERESGSERGTGVVRFAVTPWAEVVCGKEYRFGPTPFPDKTMPAGWHECFFTNPQLGIRRARIEVKANTLQKISVKF